MNRIPVEGATTNLQQPPTRSRCMDSPRSKTPAEQYRILLGAREQQAEQLDRQDHWLSRARGVVFLSGLCVLAATTTELQISPYWLLPPTGVFLLLIVIHTRILTRLNRTRRAVQYYRDASDRLDHRWQGCGADGGRYLQTDHMYSDDLDMFGHGSLFQLINCARTRLGEDTLAAWLQAPANPTQIRMRQTAVECLRHRGDLREKCAMLDAKVHQGLDQNHLIAWAQESPHPVSLKIRLTAIAFALAASATLGGWLLTDLGYLPLLVVLLFQIPFLFVFRNQIKRVAQTMDQASSGLAILSQMLTLIEDEQFAEGYLRTIRTRLDVDDHCPSRSIRQLENLVQSLNNSLQNQFFVPIALLLCLPIQLVHRIEIWRKHVGSHIPEWMATVGEFEALIAFSGYAFERPADVFPEITEDDLCLEATAVGHPLIPTEQCVRNDVRLDAQQQLILISGSNMSGKSTLLRTTGVNVILALAGAPVCAERLRVCPMQVATVMRISDSLQDGTSLFYAVISRLKSVVELTGASALPLLFLLDEILQGTNSHDRRVGTEGIIQKLLSHSAIGLITTHDLALTEIVNDLHPRAINQHFADDLSEGQMTFDYRIHPGVVQKSNALALMRLMGLEV